MCPQCRIIFAYQSLLHHPCPWLSYQPPAVGFCFPVAFFFFFFSISLWTLGLWVVTMHARVLTGQWEQRVSLLVPVVLVYRLVFPLKDTQIIGVRWTVFVSSHCHLEQQSLKQAPLQTCKEWSGSFCFSPWQHGQMGTCHWAIVFLSLLRNLPDLKPVVLHDWKSSVAPFCSSANNLSLKCEKKENQGERRFSCFTAFLVAIYYLYTSSCANVSLASASVESLSCFWNMSNMCPESDRLSRTVNASPSLISFSLRVALLTSRPHAHERHPVFHSTLLVWRCYLHGH